MLQPGVIRKRLMLMSALNGYKTHSLRKDIRRVSVGDIQGLSRKYRARNPNVYSKLLAVVLGLWSEVNNLADDNLNGLRQSVS